MALEARLDAGSLAGTLIRLAPLQVSDADEMVTVLDDPRLYVFTGGEPPTRDELGDHYRRQTLGWSEDRSERWLNWIVRRGSDDQAVGYVQATVTGQPGPTTADVAWVIGTAYQGSGYATAAATLMAEWLRCAEISTLVAFVHPDHAASQAVARAIGLSPTDQVVDGETCWRSP